MQVTFAWTIGCTRDSQLRMISLIEAKNQPIDGISSAEEAMRLELPEHAPPAFNMRFPLSAQPTIERVMAKKLRVGILFGGRSGEHEVSLLSAASILKAIDRKKFEVVPIGIAKSGQWLNGGGAHELLAGNASLQPGNVDGGNAVTAIVPGAGSPAQRVTPRRHHQPGGQILRCNFPGAAWNFWGRWNDPGAL